MMWGWGNAWGGAGEALMMVAMLAVLVLVIVGIVLLVRGLSGRDRIQPGPPLGPPNGPSGNIAMQVLAERYARGEIQREEFLRRKQDLLGD